MKLVTLIFLFFAAGSVCVEGSQSFCFPSFYNFMSDKPLEILTEELKTELLNHIGNNVKFNVPKLYINITHEALDLFGYLYDTEISNFFDLGFKFDYDEVLHEVTITTSFRNISLKGQYDLKGDIGQLIDIFGVGDYWMNLIGFNVKVGAGVRFEDHKICIFFDTFITLDDAQLHFFKLMNDDYLEDIVNDTMEFLLPELVATLWEDSKDHFEHQLLEFLEDKNNSHILELIVEIIAKGSQRKSF